jgi:hypothetical protein
MPAQAYAKRNRGTVSGGASYSRDLLERLVRILVHSGHSPKVLLREFRDICSDLKEPARTWDPTQLTYFFDLPHVIAHWHSDPQYLDSRGVPIALALRAKGPSLSALIERVLPQEDPEQVVRSLMRLKGVRRVGRRYVPSARYFTYRQAVGRIHGLSALRGMLRTVERNVTGKKAPALFERAALNPSFPVSALPGYNRRLEAQASKFLWDQDGTLRSLEAQDPEGPRVRLGVGVFVFEEPILETRARGRRRGARTQRRTPRVRVAGRRRRRDGW